jgi:hypothetical protein
MGLMVLGLNPLVGLGVGVRFSIPIQVRPKSHPAPEQWVLGLSLGVKLLGLGDDHTHPF